MSSILEKQIVLNLNRNWEVIGVRSVRQSITALCGGVDGEHPAMAMDLAPTVLEDGSYDFENLEYVNPVPWETWVTLPVRDFDLAIDTARGQIRVPTITISSNYTKVPLKRPKLSKRAIWERDGGVCGYTGKKVTYNTGNVDHVVPRDKGGRDTWENLVVSCKEINSLKGNRFNHEVGLKLIRQPKTPPSIPISASITEAKHPSWRQFLIISK